MPSTARIAGNPRNWVSRKSFTRTTLYDLVARVADSVPSQDDHYVSQVVSQLLKSGRAKFIHSGSNRRYFPQKTVSS